MNLFYILQILSRETDDSHPLSASALAERVNMEFGYLSPTGVIISADTVKRIMEDLLDKIFLEEMDTHEAGLKYGYWIYCVMKKSGRYIPFRQKEGCQAPKKYYYLEHDLKEAELLVLKDAMETYSYFSEDDITSIVRKISRLRPTAFPKGRYIDIARLSRDENSLLLINIGDLNDMIRASKGLNPFTV